MLLQRGEAQAEPPSSRGVGSKPAFMMRDSNTLSNRSPAEAPGCSIDHPILILGSPQPRITYHAPNFVQPFGASIPWLQLPDTGTGAAGGDLREGIDDEKSGDEVFVTG